MVLGNCQAQYVEGMIATGSRGVTIERVKPVFELLAADEASVAASFAAADVVFLQRVSEDYQLEWVRPSVVKARYPGKVVTWPNIYFDGYFPDARYIYLAPYGKLQGPLDDYHFGRVLAAHKAGAPVADAVRALIETELEGDERAFDASLANLRQRESGIDAIISDFLDEEVRRGQCFYTPNHPHNFVLVEMARRLMARAGIHFDVSPAQQFGFRLDKVRIPPYRPIARRMFSREPEPTLFQGLAVEAVSATTITLGAAAMMDPTQLIEQFYRVYDVSFPQRSRDPGRSAVAAVPREAALAGPADGNGRRRRIGLVGLFGSGNFGPELFRRAVQTAMGDAELTVLDTQALITDPAARARFMGEIDAVLIGGSDLVIPSTFVPRYFSDVLLEKPVFFFGVGVPTWAGVDQDVVRKLRQFFAHPNVRLCATRDVESARWIATHLAPGIGTRSFADPMCALELPEVARSPGLRIFTLVTRQLTPGEIAWDKLRALCERARQSGYTVRNLILGTGEIARQDLDTVRTEARSFQWDLVTSEDEQVLITAIAESSAMASMKLQGGVIAAMYGIPAIGLIATDKFENFYRAIDRPDLRAHHTHPDLPERLPKYLAPIPGSTIRELRSSAAEGLAVLGRSIAEAFAPEAERAPLTQVQ